MATRPHRAPRRLIPVVLILLVGAVLGLAPHAEAQSSDGELPINPRLLETAWPAQWITHPEAEGTEFGVYHFRRTLQLETRPDSFVVHTSGDNRYQLFVNGERVRMGPARGDLAHWRFETTDLAPYLQQGANVVAATVWNFGEHRPVAQISYETGFLLQGNDERASRINTDDDWRVTRNEGYSPIPRSAFNVDGYLVVGPGERVDAREVPWGWTEIDYDAEPWTRARTLRPGMPEAGPTRGIYEAWKLVPRSIPPMESTPQRFSSIRRAQSVHVPETFPEGDETMVVPPDTEATLLLDQAHLTTAYPVLRLSGGANGRIKITYAEALYDDDGRKGNRNVTEGKIIRGIQDVFRPDGGEQRRFRPLWWRTFRYVQLDIQTGDDPLRLHDIYSVYTAYPFEENGTFASSDSTLEQIWDVGWRTARVCANETYFDTPYWEQLQYVGDTRIQALISLYVDGDDRLMRKALRAYNHSRVSNGLTESRYPSHQQQFIPGYSLLWISMVHDYWMHRDDPAFVRSFLTPIRGVVEWYAQHVDEDGLVGKVPWWSFVDWAYESGIPPGADEGQSVILSLQFAYTLDHAANLAAAFDRSDDAAYYRTLSDSLKTAVREHGWDDERGLLADTPAKDTFSQHANILGVLTNVFSESTSRTVMEQLLADTSLVPATYYYRFYLHRALKDAGLGHRYVELLQPWREMLSRGLTTFAEEPDPTRSDSHAWSAHPNYQLLALVAGIRPAAPGFSEVRIEPVLGSLKHVEANVPHPEGTIRVNLERRGDQGLDGRVVLPETVTGTFSWQGTTLQLDGGSREIDL